MEQIRWYVGIDWASREHQVCVTDAAGQVLEERAVPHSGEGLEELIAELLRRTDQNPQAVGVAIELPHGPVVEALLERRFAVFAVNPKQLDRFRDRFGPSGAKDDRRDARVLASALRTDEHAFRRLEPEEPTLVELREWSRLVEELTAEQVRWSNRMRDGLRRYYPQMLELGADGSDPWFLDLWQAVPTPAKARRIRDVTIRKVLRKHRIRRLTPKQVHDTLRTEPLRVADGTVQAACAQIEVAVAQLRLIHTQLRHGYRQLDRLIGELMGAEEGDEPGQKREQHDVEILYSFPGVGRITLAVLLAEASQPLRERDYHRLRSVTGVAPVTCSSGTKRVVLMRRACNPRLRTAMHHIARVAVQRDPRWKQQYGQLRARGKVHAAALRIVGDRILRTMCAMLRNRQPYQPAEPAAA